MPSCRTGAADAAREIGTGGTHLLDQQVAHPSGDASNSDAGRHVIPPQSDRAILLARARKQLQVAAWRFCSHGTARCCADFAKAAASCIVLRRLLADDVEPVVLDLPVERLQPGFGHHLRATLPELPVNPPGEMQRFRLQWAGDRADRHLATRGRVPVRRSEQRPRAVQGRAGRHGVVFATVPGRSRRLARDPGVLVADPIIGGSDGASDGETLPPAYRRSGGRSSLPDAVRSHKLAGSTDAAARRLADRPDLSVPATDLLRRVRHRAKFVCDH